VCAGVVVSAPRSGGKLPGVHPGELRNGPNDYRFDHHAFEPSVFGVVVAEAFNGQSKQVHSVGGFIHPPARHTGQRRGLVGHGVNDESGVSKVFWGNFFEVLHHGFDNVDKRIRAAPFRSQPGPDHQ